MTTATQPTLSFIPDLVEEHFDELQFLWTQRRMALRSAAYTGRELGMLEERIEAHAEGIRTIGDRVWDFLAAAVEGDEEMPAFAAAFTLLRLATPRALDQVVRAFASASSAKLDGLVDAVSHGPASPILPSVAALLSGARLDVAAAAAEVLAFHGASAPSSRQIEAFIHAEDSRTRARGWRVAAHCGTAMSGDSYVAGFADGDSAVQSAAFAAAAWGGSPTLHARCRDLAATPTPALVEPSTVFAAYAQPADYQFIESLATRASVGPRRFGVVGAFAHPYFIDLLIKGMTNADPLAALSATAAFFKMTGRDVESNTRVKISPDGKPPADDFEAEFQDEVFLPDPDLARKHWQELEPTLARSPRICRGMDVSIPLSREQFATLDMESRWEYCLRMRLFSGWQGTPLVLERYPQRF